MQGQNPAAMVAHLKSRNEDRAEIIQEYNTKIAATQTTVMSSSRDSPTTIATARALPKTKAI
jgi:hypothetical protein